MCDEQRRGSAQESLENLRQPMPLVRKISFLVSNNWRKLRTRSDCCGNYGEPGC